MNFENILPLALGFILFSFLVTSITIVPFIDLLYKLKITRRKEGGVKGANQSLFDKLHDIKAGTPIGGGVLIIAIVAVLFMVLVPFVSYLGVFIASSFNLYYERIIILFTFLSFGALGFFDDYVKIFGKPRPGRFGAIFGISDKSKFLFQWILALITAWGLYRYLGIHILHVPVINIVIDLSVFYIPFAAFIIVFFANAFNITDGLDGLSLGLLVIYLFAYVIIAVGSLDTPLFIFISLWLGSILAFLYFNVWPARVFLGDAGALSFGAMIAVIGLITGNVTTLFVIGGVFVLEALSSLIQILGWKFLKRPIFPLAPLHHSFLAIGWEEPKIVMRAWLVGIILAILGLWMATI